ncbi:phage late control D family protein [Gilliamella sp. CG16]|uniref:phage late control D family protein n=1 Tax=Gilliamella sp. CG16 TaxID=3351503 RepID=UPI0039883503
MINNDKFVNFVNNAARKTRLILTYDSVDITHDISNFIVSFSFTERAKNGESDDLNITVENSTGIWSNDWFPERGATLHAQIITENWNQPNDYHVLDCGSFEIDDLTDSGPASIFSIGALSVGITSNIRGELHSQAWENFKLSTLVAEFAGRHSFSVFFDSDYDPVIDRFDQKNESDLEFLLKIAEYVGVNVRLSHGKIIVYQDRLYDAKMISLTLTKNTDGYINHSFRASSADIYSACQVQFLDSRSGKLVTYQYAPNGRSGVMGSSESSGGGTKIDPETRMVINRPKPNPNNEITAPKTGKILKINQRCSSLAEAENLAKSCLRRKNSREITGTLTYVGNLYLRAGLTIGVSGFGVWDCSTWVIEEVQHSWSVSGGLTTSISIRGILGY